MNAEELIHKLQALDTSTEELVKLAHEGRPLWSPEVWVEDDNGYRQVADVVKADGGIYIRLVNSRAPWIQHDGVPGIAFGSGGSANPERIDDVQRGEIDGVPTTITRIVPT